MDQEPNPTPLWAILDEPDTQDESSVYSEPEDQTDEIQGTSSPLPAPRRSNVIKRSRDALAGAGPERPQKRRRQGAGQTASGSGARGEASVANSTRPSRRETGEELMDVGSSIDTRAQPVAQRAEVQKQSGSARRPVQSDSSGNESGSSSIMIIDENIVPPTSRPAPQMQMQNVASAGPKVKAPATAQIEISDSEDEDEDESSSSPAAPVTQGVARKSVRGPPPHSTKGKGPAKPHPPPSKLPQNVKGKEPVKPRPSMPQVKAKPPPAEPPNPPTAKGKEPAKPPPPDAEIIEVSSDEDSPPRRTQSSDVPQFQKARKTTGAKPPPPPPKERVKIRSRVSDPQPRKGSSGSGLGSAAGSRGPGSSGGAHGKKASTSGSGTGASTPAGGTAAPEIGWNDFASLIDSAPEGINDGASASTSNKAATTQAAGTSVSVKVAPRSPQKVPSGNLDSFVVNRGKRAPRLSAASNNDGDVDMRPLPEALGLSKAAHKAEKRKEIAELKRKVDALSSSNKQVASASNDLPNVINHVGRSNTQSQSFATSKKLKPKPKPKPKPSPAVDPMKGVSVDAPIDLTFSDDDEAPPARPPPGPQRPPSNPRLTSPEVPLPRAPPLPQRNKSNPRLSAAGPPPVLAPAGKAPTPPPGISQPAAPPPLPTTAAPQPIQLAQSVTVPHLLSELQQSPTRRHTIPTPIASSATQRPTVPAITRIASPMAVGKQAVSGPPPSPPSILSPMPSRSPTPERDPSPIPADPLESLFTPPPLDLSRIINAATVQSTPLAPQPISLPRASLPGLIPLEAPKDVPHNQASVGSIFTDDESDGEQPQYSRSIDRLFDEDDDDEVPTTANRSDAEAAMEVDALLAPRDHSVSSDVDNVTEAMGSQKLKTASPSEGSASRSDSFGPAATSEDPFDDFYASDSDDPVASASVPVQTPALAPSSASVSSRGSEPRTPPDTEDLPVVSTVTGKSYGGLAAITFEDWRVGYQPVVRFCDEFLKGPELQSYINSFSAEYRMMGGTQQILSAHIAYNTREDEPNAPPIEILNKVDNDPAPPWEFWYTNQMYHGPGVPLPDGSQLKGCDCVGKCDPRSKTCQCVARQRVYFDGSEDYGLGFIYDKQKRLRPLLAGYAIWECNDLCGCDEECMNRVVQRGRTVQVSIQKTEKKGWGVFAGPKKIPRGTFLGVYSGEILNEEDSHHRGQVYEKWGRTYLFDIDFYHLERLKVQEPTYTIDAYHAGNFTRFLNHSCDPNSRLYPCYINEAYIAKPLLVVFSVRDIEPHEEICFSYTGIYPDDEPDDDRDAEAPAIKRADWKKCYCGTAKCDGIMFA